MGLEFIGMMVQMLFALGTILLLMLLTYRVTSKKVNNINNQKYINVLERVQISKDTYICVVKVGKKGHVLSTAAGKTDIIQELSEDEINEIEEKKKQELQKNQQAYTEVLAKFKLITDKIKKKYILKEDTYEK